MKDYKISLGTAILMSINIMAGTGILIGPGVIAALSGNASFLAWPLVAVMFLPLVISVVQLNRLCPGSGGMYSYAKRGLGETAGYASGLLYVVGYTFAASVEILALRETLLVATGTNALTENPIIFNAVLIGACMVVNMMSLRSIGRFLSSLTITKVLPLIILIGLLPFVFNVDFTISAAEMAALPLSVFPMAIFGFFGFEYCCSISHLIEDSERNAPRALTYGFLITALIYTLFHFGLLNLMGADNLAQFGAPAFANFLALPIPYLKTFLSFLIPLSAVLALFAGTNGMVNANATMIQSMAAEKLFAFSGPLAQVSALGRPWVAVLFQGALMFSVATLIPYISIVGGLCNLGVFLSFVLPFVSLLSLKRRDKRSTVLTLLALSITLGLIAYGWVGLGTTYYERILYSLPLVGAVSVGFALRTKK